jgi:putative lipoic acid-binding regulatory protein
MKELQDSIHQISKKFQIEDIKLQYSIKKSCSSTYQAMSVRIDMQIIAAPNSTVHSLIGLR